MKKNFFLFFLLTTLTVLGLSFSHTQNVAASIFDDSPDNADGFASGDPCGFVKGTSTPYRLMSINADGVSPDTDQACADASGYFYEYDYPTKSPLTDRDSIIQLEYALSAVTYTLDIDLVGSTYQTVVDQTTGRWSGYGYITDASYPGTNRWVWFDWTCAGVGGDCPFGSKTNLSHRVKTDLDTGAITGYAWNDDLGFISFRNLTMELPPQ